MKITVIILGVLGALCMGMLAGKWISDYNDNKKEVAQMVELTKSLGKLGGSKATAELDSALAHLERLHTASFVMLAAAFLSLASVLFIGKLGKATAAILLASAIIPAIMAPQSLLAGFLLIIAGGLALRVKPPQAALGGHAARVAA